MSVQKLLIIDGSYYLHRNFHALPPTYNKVGEPTWAVRGATHSVQKSLRQISPTHVAITFDMGGDTFRHQIYPAYKSDRPPAAPELTAQREPLIQILKAMGLCVVTKDWVEADDIMGTLAYKASKYGMTVVISTGDKDMCQMVDERTTLFNPFAKTNQVMDEEGVFDKYGVYPQNFADLLALIGDKADSIPGVNGFGVKTASSFLRTWGTIEQMVEHKRSLEGAAGDKFRANTTLALMCKRLTTLKCDLELGLTLKQLLRGHGSIEAEKLRVLKARYDFTQHKSMFGNNPE